MDIFNTPEMTSFIVVTVLIVFAIILIPFIFYLLTLQNTLKAIAPPNRRMPPANVWLMFIPLFSLVWGFIMVNRISDSIKAELAMRGTPTDERPTYSIGLAMCILSCCGWIPILGGFAGIAALVCLIIYWIRVNEYKNKFLSEPYAPDSESKIFGGVGF